MQNKKGELSINVIILVVLGLVILAVMIYLVLSNTDNYKDSTACASAGGYCQDFSSDCDLIQVQGGDPCAKQNKQCCVIGS